MPTKKPSKELLNKVSQSTNLIRTIENDLRKSANIEKTVDLTVYEKKIIAYLISKIKPGTKNLEPIRLKYSEFCKVMNIAICGKNYYKIKEAIENLYDKSFKVLTKGGEPVYFHWFEGEKSHIKESKKEVVLQLSNSLNPFLLNLKRNFCAYELGYVVRFRKKHTFRLYEFLKAYAGIGFCHYNIENFKNLVIGNTYNNVADIKRYILEPAKDEINNFSDLNISFNINKKYSDKCSHNPAETITFFISQKSNEEKFEIWKTLGFNPEDLKKLKIVDNKGNIISEPKKEKQKSKYKRNLVNTFKKLNIDIECDDYDIEFNNEIEIDYDEDDLPF